MYDLDDNPLANGSVSVESGGISNLQIKIDCRSGYILRVKNPVEIVAVNAKHNTDSVYTDLETGSIDLSLWNGSREIFDIRLTGDTVSARTLKTVVLSVEIG